MNLTIGGIAALGLVLLFFLVGWARGLLGEILSLVGILIVGVTVYYVSPYVSTFLADNTQVRSWIEDNCQSLVDHASKEVGEQAVSSLEQSALVQSLPLPEGMRQELLENNKGEVYSALGVDSFLEYLVAFLAEKIYWIFCILITWILSSILVGIVSSILQTIAKLPGIRQVNHMAGGALGAAKGALVVWLCLLILTVACGTQWGQQGLDMVQQDTVLSWMYDKTISPLTFLDRSGEAMEIL